MSNESLIEKIAGLIVNIFEPLYEAALEDPNGAGIVNLVKEIGWDITDYLPANLANAIENAFGIISGNTGDPSKILDLFTSVDDLIETIDVLNNFGAGFEDLAMQLLDYLIVTFLQREFPLIHNILAFMGVIQINRNPPDPPRQEYLSWTIDWENIPRIITDPQGLLRDLYSWGENEFNPSKILVNIQNLLWSFGIGSSLQRHDEFGIRVLDANSIADDPMLKLSILEKQEDDNIVEAGVGILPLRNEANTGYDGLGLVPFGIVDISETFDLGSGWNTKVSLSSSFSGLFGILLRFNRDIETRALDPGIGSPPSVGISIEISKTEEGTEKIILFGDAESSRLEAASLGFKVGSNIGLGSDSEYFIEGFLKEAKLVIQPSQGDGFLQKILPAEGFSINFDLTMGWSNLVGFYFKGSAGLEITIPVHKSLGPIHFESIYVNLQITEEGRFLVQLSVTWCPDRSSCSLR